MAHPALLSASRPTPSIALPRPLLVRPGHASALQPGKLRLRLFRSRRTNGHRVARSQSSQTSTADPEVDVVEVELKVKGMTCEHCSARVHDALAELDNVKQAHVSLESGIAKVQVDAPSLFDAWNQLPKIVELVSSLGFEAEPHFPDPEEE